MQVLLLLVFTYLFNIIIFQIIIYNFLPAAMV